MSWSTPHPPACPVASWWLLLGDVVVAGLPLAFLTEDDGTVTGVARSLRILADGTALIVMVDRQGCLLPTAKECMT